MPLLNIILIIIIEYNIYYDNNAYITVYFIHVHNTVSTMYMDEWNGVLYQEKSIKNHDIYIIMYGEINKSHELCIF